MTRALATFALVGAAACAPPPKDLGRVQLNLWEPLAFADAPLVNNADDLLLVARVDGVEVGRTTAGAGGPLALPSLPADVDGAAVDFEVRATGGTVGLAVGRAGPVVLDGDPPVVRLGAVLAPPNEVHLLFPDLPQERDGAAACSDAAGKAWIVGGDIRGTLAQGSFLVDPANEQVVPGPGLDVQRRGAACVADEQGGVWLLGGCDGESPVTTLEHAFPDQNFTGKGPAVEGADCGAAIGKRGETLLLVVGDRVEARDTTGAILADAPLDPPRLSPHVAVLAADPPRFLVAGGVGADGTPVDGAAIVTVQGGALDVRADARPILLAANGPTGALALIDDEVVRLSEDGGRAQSLGFVDAALAPTALAATAKGRAALLSADGSTLVVVGGDAPASFSLEVPRPGGALLPDGAGTLRLVGGGAPGVHVLVVD